MALIGNSSIVSLGEPSASMDPGAGKKMWKIVGSIKNKISCYFDDTFNEKAEALCDE